MEPIMEMRSFKGKQVQVSGKAAKTGFGAIRDGEYDGNPCQVKCFSADELARTGCEQALYENLKVHLERKPLGAWFLWPVDLFTWESSFGYVLNGELKNYLSLADLMEQKGNYESLSSIANAALNLISAFAVLNNAGYKFLHMTEDDIFIHPRTGQILIGNVEFATGNTSWKPICVSRLIPPSGVINNPTCYWSWNKHMLAVLLFELLYLSHPLEGERAAAYAVMDEKTKKIIYGIEPCFVQDTEDDSNRPVRGIHINLRHRWETYPDYLRKLFFNAFSKAALKGQDSGISCKKWHNAFMKLRSYIISCPFCGRENIWKPDVKCRKCKKSLASPAVYYRVNQETYPVFPGGVIYREQIEDNWMAEPSREEVGKFVKGKNDSSVCFLQNTTMEAWRIHDPNGNEFLKAPKETVMPADGMDIMIQDKIITFHSEDI